MIYFILFIIVVLLLLHTRSLKTRMLELENLEVKERTQLESNVMSKILLIRWIEEKNHGREVATYLKKEGLRRIAIYGMAEVGDLLYSELKEAGIEVICGIDQSKTEYYQRGRASRDLKVVKPEDFHEEVDAIVVTVTYYFSEVFDNLNARLEGRVPILGLDEIIYELHDSDKESLSLVKLAKGD